MTVTSDLAVVDVTGGLGLYDKQAFSLVGIQRAAATRLADPDTVLALVSLIDDNPLLFGDFGGSREELIRILAQYNHAGSGIDDVAGMLDFQGDALAVSLMDDDRRAVFARELLAKFFPADTMAEDKDIELLLQVHHLHGDKNFWELSATDKQEIRNLLATRPLFEDKSVQDYLMYNVVCGSGKPLLLLLCVFLLIGLSCVDKPADSANAQTGPAPEPSLSLPSQLSPEQIVSQQLMTYRLSDGVSRSVWRVCTQGSGSAQSMYYRNVYEGTLDLSDPVVVVHSTANIHPWAGALRHAFHLDTTGLTSPRWCSSRHVSLDASVIAQHYPITGDNIPACWHAGDRVMNGQAFGIEVCEIGDHDAAVANLIYTLKVFRQLYPNVRIIRHYDVTGKPCPRIFSDAERDAIIQQI